MSNFKLVLFAVSLGLLLLASRAQAETIVFQDDFEGYAATTVWLTTDTDYDPGTPPIGETWYVNEPTAVYCVSVLDGTITYSPGPRAGGTGTQYLVDAHGQLNNVAGMPISAANQGTIASNGNLTLDMWMYHDNSGTYDGQTTIVGYNSAAGSTANATFDLRFEDNLVEYNNGTAIVDTGLTFSGSAWTRLTVVADFATHTYDVTLGGSTATGLAFASNESTIQHVLLGGIIDGNQAKGFYDDIVITIVPEPGTLSLLGMGLISLLACAWRRRK